MLPRDPQKPSHLRVGGSGTADQLGEHLVEDIPSHTQFYDGGAGDGEVGCHVGHALMVAGVGDGVFTSVGAPFH